MHRGMWITACAVAMATGALAVRANAEEGPPVAKTPEADAMAKAFETPRYYAITASGGMTTLNGGRICFGGEPLRKLLSGFADASRDPAFVGAVGKGCTSETARDGKGRVTIEHACSKAAGAPFTSRLRVSGAIADIEQHMEITLAGAGGQERTVVSDMTMHYIGACPASLKPGQSLWPDGRVTDFPLG